MKKILTLILALTMTISLVGCGEVDTTTAIEQFHLISAKLDEVSEIANPNADLLGNEIMDELILISDELIAFKAELESEDITQERADEIEEFSEHYFNLIESYRVNVEEILANPVLAKVQSVKQIIAELAELYNEVADLAIENGWEAEELTTQELNVLATFLESTNADGFYDEVAALEEAEIDALLEQCQVLKDSLPLLLERVSNPYVDEM